MRTQQRARSGLRLSFALPAALAFGLSAGSCDEAPSPSAEGASSALASETIPVDAPSTPPIVLRWTRANDGQKSLRSLDFEVENTTDRAINVELHFTSNAGVRSSSWRGPSVAVNAHARVAQAIGVEQLGLQLVGASVSTLGVATYQGQDGLTRSMPLPLVWVEHDPGFAAARVRGAAVEAKTNAQRGFANVRSRRPSAARVLDAATGGASVLADLSDFSAASGSVGQMPEFPDPAQDRIPKVASGAAEVDDAERGPIASEVAEGAFDKGGNFSICLRMPYSFVDSNWGEDYLNAPPLGWAWEPAHYQYAFLTDASGSVGWQGYLNSNGCTPLLSHPNGTYYAWTTTALYVSERNVFIALGSSDTSGYVWGFKSYSISSSGGTITVDLGAFDSLEQLDATVSAANTLYRATTAYPNNTYTTVYTTRPCRNSSDPNANEGCTDPETNIIWLGYSTTGLAVSWFKVVTEHELGHRVQNAMIGNIPHPYAIDQNVPASCHCDHVTSVTNLHCLQSRHQQTTAQVEGWGHFFAATSLNNGADSNCVFPYYKEFREDNGTIVQPPIAKSCFDQIKWRQNHCAANGQGVEWDWMNFYWRLDKKDNYALTDFGSVYRQACGGSSCTSSTASWTSLTAAATAVFGTNSAKALAWSSAGNTYGAAN